MNSRGLKARNSSVKLDFTESELHDILQAIQSTGINFLAVDFDKTFVSIHTYGNWPGSAADLSNKVRPFFKLFIPMAMNAGISVAVYFLASSFAVNETSSVIIAVSVAFMLTARFIIQVLGSIEKSIIWINDDMNNISDHSVKGDVAD
jgi:hypothetical protein